MIFRCSLQEAWFLAAIKASGDKTKRDGFKGDLFQLSTNLDVAEFEHVNARDAEKDSAARFGGQSLALFSLPAPQLCSASLNETRAISGDGVKQFQIPDTGRKTLRGASRPLAAFTSRFRCRCGRPVVCLVLIGSF